MKVFSKVLLVLFVVSFVFGLSAPVTVHAATTPSLGAAATYGILSNLFQHNIAATTITGDPANAPTVGVLGYSSEAGVGAVVVLNGTTYINDATWTAAGVAQNAARNNVVDGLLVQPCTSIGAIVDLASYDTDGGGGLPPGTFPPGCYSSTGAMNIGGGGTVTLQGSGTYIFRPGDGGTGALGTTASSQVVLSGASACDVFWAPTAATTLGANSIFVGTIIDPAGVTMDNLAAVTGRILAYGGTVTADSNSVTVPICALPPPPSGPPVPSSSTLPLPLINVTKIPTPLALPSGPGLVTYDYTVTNLGLVTMANITVTDDKCPSVVYISGDTNGNSNLGVTETWHYRCTTTLAQTTLNTVTATGMSNGFITIDTAYAIVVVGAAVIPPLIHLVKVPNVFVLPAGGGAVTYAYSVTNPGTAPLSNVNITDDKCTGLPGRVVGHPGDLNHNDLLESNETWQFTCLTNLTQSTTNTGAARGSANGFTVVDYSLATVVVSPPVITPPPVVVPTLPNTGTASEGKSMPWNIVIISGILMVSILYLARRKQTI